MKKREPLLRPTGMVQGEWQNMMICERCNNFLPPSGSVLHLLDWVGMHGLCSFFISTCFKLNDEFPRPSGITTTKKNLWSSRLWTNSFIFENVFAVNHHVSRNSSSSETWPRCVDSLECLFPSVVLRVCQSDRCLKITLKTCKKTWRLMIRI